jgi:hypothetical protein
MVTVENGVTPTLLYLQWCSAERGRGVQTARRTATTPIPLRWFIGVV